MYRLIATAAQPIELLLTFELAAPARLRVRGVDDQRAYTCHFDRLAGTRREPLAGQVTLAFPLPLAPATLGITAKAVDAAGRPVAVRLVHTQGRELAIKPLVGAVEDQEFLAWAQWLALALPTLPLTRDPRYPLHADTGGFMVRILNVIRNRDTGRAMSTPARINRVTGIMELARKKMLAYTVPMRLVVMLHEWIHLRDQTQDEALCDRRALELFVAAGYSLSEGLYAFAKVFGELPALQERVALAAEYLAGYDEAHRRPRGGAALA